MDNIILNSLEVSDNQVDFYFTPSKGLQKYFSNSNYLFLQYNNNLRGIPISILSIPFVANVIPLIWISNSNLYIDELDESFYNCLEKIKIAYQEMFPGVKFLGNLYVKRIIKNSYDPSVEAATLFSGGLDAVTTFFRIQNKNPMLITEYGWHNDKIVENDVWSEDKENAENFAGKFGLDNILIQSNYGNFVNAFAIDKDYSKKLNDTWWHGLHHSLAIISAAIPIAYKLKVKCIYIASSYSQANPFPCASDPTIDNEVKFASGEVFHDAFELTRQQKVSYIINKFHTVPVGLRVCFKNKENCCNCEKCWRTILAIIAEGGNPKEWGFDIPPNISNRLKLFLSDNVKTFLSDKVYYWECIQQRMKENFDKFAIIEKFNWFILYDLKKEQKRALINYRLKYFFPIIKRRIKERVSVKNKSLFFKIKNENK